ncbi:hypothetical protein SAMN02745857_04311 [Andreprevotia lacus DSM 23236]|uniref:Uncharacterized protein n=1 Tax=Andreprevotia lacus DSM 23236 TaxID=1121001 RepID=A0A1W1Y1F4_9NEIS|nr:hypothetical protein [Andreprevotia lacus]SMC29967.1 hypothetical protein SAMN02745857_04311 [Andreprevotia lacus DSM 23236]
MSDTALLITLLLRGGQIALLLQIAWLLWRDYRHALAARLGVLLTIGTIAFVVNSTPPIAPMGLARLPITLLDAGNSWVMFLFARALMEDDFRLRRWHALPWLLLAGIGAVNCVWLHPQHHPWAGKVATLQSTSTLLLALATTLTALRDWRSELVEPRRLVRVTLICGCGIYALSVPLRALTMGEDFATASRMHAFDGSLGITLFYCGFLLRRPRADLLFPPANGPAVGDETPPSSATTETSTTEKPDYQPDPAQLAQLEHLMSIERLYRHEDLVS